MWIITSAWTASTRVALPGGTDTFLQNTITDSNTFAGLFYGNTGLTDASGLLLPATTLALSCYQNMFYDCASLTNAPSLPATTLAGSCYESMFKSCTSLTTAPELPATTLAQYCYSSMFNGCSKLSAVTCLATDITESGCTTDWLEGVAATGTFTKASDMTSWETGASGIPSGWTVANYGE